MISRQGYFLGRYMPTRIKRSKARRNLFKNSTVSYAGVSRTLKRPVLVDRAEILHFLMAIVSSNFLGGQETIENSVGALFSYVYTNNSFVFASNCSSSFKAIRYEATSMSRIVANRSHHLRLGLRDAIRLTDSFLYTLGYCVNFGAIRYE